jgi:hypothetical protein
MDTHESVHSFVKGTFQSLEHWCIGHQTGLCVGSAVNDTYFRQGF